MRDYLYRSDNRTLVPFANMRADELDLALPLSLDEIAQCIEPGVDGEETPKDIRERLLLERDIRAMGLR